MSQVRASSGPAKKEVYAALQYAASFHCVVEEWHDCEELKPKPTVKWTFRGQKHGSSKTSHGVACGRKQLSLHEDARKCVRAQAGWRRTAITS